MSDGSDEASLEQREVQAAWSVDRARDSLERERDDPDTASGTNGVDGGGTDGHEGVDRG